MEKSLQLQIFRSRYDTTPLAFSRYAIYLMLVLAVTLVIPFNSSQVFALSVLDDLATTNEGIPVTFDIIGNDDYASDPPTVTIVTPPSHGIISNPVLDSSEQVTYTPNTNFYGIDTFQYKITENGIDSNVGTVTIVVVQTQVQNMPPIAVPDSFTIPQGISSIQLNVLANDHDPENDPLIVISVFGPQHGIVSISSDQKFVIYKPFNGYSGPDSFTYTISDGHNHGSSVSTITTTSSVQVVENNQMPTVTISSPSNNSILFAHSVSINGMASNPSGLSIQQVTISINGGTPIPATLSGSNWSVGTTLPDGQYNVVATATDIAGSTATTSITITVDTTAPTITIASPSNGTTLTTTTTPLSGTAVDGGSGIQQVTISINGGTPIPATLSGSNWSISSVNLVLGSNIISATAKDNVGNTATTSITVTVNTLNPPVITTPLITVNSPTQTINGTADPNVTIKVYSGTTLVGTTTSDANGKWSLQVTLAQGPNTFTATETKSGITSGLSNSVTLNLNTTPPSISITSPSNGAILNNHTVSITGIASDSSGSGIQQVTISINGGTPIPATLSGSNWSVGTTLPDGQYNVVATAKTNVGNTATTSITITVDTTAPTITISSPTTGATVSSPVTITGTAADSRSGIKQIDVSIDNGSFSTATGTASWSLGTTLTPGTHTITARATDNAGNTTTTSITITIPLKPSIQQMDGYVIFGTKDVHVEENTIVTSGSVGLQNKGQIHIEENSSLISSSVVGDTIHLEKKSVTAATYYNTLQIEKQAIAGTKTTPLVLPVVPSMPDFPSSFVVGTTNINVKSGSQTITPGNYNNISANKKAVLEFTGGTYHINSLSVQDGVTLKFDSPSLIFVKSSVDAGQGTVLNPSIDADKVLFYAGSHIHVGQSSTVNANMYAPNDEIHLDQNSRDTGAFIAKSVHVEEGSIVNFDYGFPHPSGVPVTDVMIETHGKGSIGSNINFNFSVKPSKNNILQGQLQYSDKSVANINLQSLSILTLTLNPNGSATFTGTATVNSANGYTFSVTVQDVADNSPNPDVFQIQIFKGTSKIYSNPGPVTQGDVEVETFNHNDAGQKD